MKLEHFRSDWNGQRSDKPYHQKPLADTIMRAQIEGKAYQDNCVVFASDSLVEVRTRIVDGIALNSYRDFYSISK